MHQEIAIEDRLTPPDEPGHYSSGTGPGDWFVADIIAQKQAAGEVWVDQHSALTYSAVWACVRYISQTVACLGWHVYERQGDGRSKRPIEDDVAWLLGMQASPEMDALNFRQVMLRDALTYGNGYAEIERDRGGRPLWLWRIDPARVCLERDEQGALYYAIRNPLGGWSSLDPNNVFHLRGLSPDGLVGYSPVSMARRAIGLAMSTENYGATFFSRGPMPGGMLKVPGRPTDGAVEKVRDSFERAYGGSHRAGRVVVLYGGMEFGPLTLPNDDAQFLESRNFSIEEICRIYGVPQHKVSKLDRSTNNNIEHQAIEAVQDCLLPWCRRLESEADVKLFGRTNRGRRFTRLNLGTLLRGDSVAQTDTVTRRVAGGLMTINEGREYLDLNPHPDGDELLVQGAMAPLDRILNPPAPPPPPAPPNQGEDGARPDGDLPEDVAAPFRVLLSRTFSSLLRVEADKAKRAANKGELVKHIGNYYSPESKRHVAETLTPIVAAALLALKRDSAPAANLAAHFADDHCRRSTADLADGGAIRDDERWRRRPDEQATEVLNDLWRMK